MAKKKSKSMKDHMAYVRSFIGKKKRQKGRLHQGHNEICEVF